MEAAQRILIFSPNWLGDAVMALPAIADVRRAYPDATLVVAARPSVAPLFPLVREVDDVVEIGSRANGRRRAKASAERHRFDVALLLPNSFNTALFAFRAGIPERWGYRADARTLLLTRAVRRPRGLHQVAYYQQLVAALGIPNGPSVPRIEVDARAAGAGERLLRDAGWDGKVPLVGIAPGAAYGGAKRWPPEQFGQLARRFAGDGIGTAMVGSAADAATGREVEQAAGAGTVINLIGRTSLAVLAGVLRACRAVVSNDSGAMHLAAAAGVPLAALFGPTSENETAPRVDSTGDSGVATDDSRPTTDEARPATEILVHPVWCRPCMLRECPLDHACMRGITVAEVRTAVDSLLAPGTAQHPAPGRRRPATGTQPPAPDERLC